MLLCDFVNLEISARWSFTFKIGANVAENGSKFVNILQMLIVQLRRHTDCEWGFDRCLGHAGLEAAGWSRHLQGQFCLLYMIPDGSVHLFSSDAQTDVKVPVLNSYRSRIVKSRNVGKLSRSGLWYCHLFSYLTVTSIAIAEFHFAQCSIDKIKVADFIP